MAEGRKGDVANGDGANATKRLNRIAQGFFSPQIGGRGSRKTEED